MLTAQELEDMERDYIQMDRDRVEEICHEVMREQLLDYETVKEELRLMREGHTIVVPKDVEHARAMFKMACFYLSQYDEDFKLKMEM